MVFRTGLFRPVCLLSRNWLNVLSRKIHSIHSVKNLLASTDCIDGNILVKGWVKSERSHKGVTFLNISDGSCLGTIQAVSPADNIPEGATYGSCVEVTGPLVKSIGPSQPFELKIEEIKVLGKCDGFAYPFKSKKHHPTDYVRQFLHLRPKTNQGAVILRIRSAASKAVHDFFHENDYTQIHTPILTSNDCEGGGEVFEVKPPAEAKIPQEKDESGRIRDYFNTRAYLTVSGQLHLEVAAGAFPKVYTFSPTFRAEPTRGRNHLAEFQMIEAEVAFTKSLEDLMEIIESLIKYVTRRIFEKCEEDLNWCHEKLAPKDHKIVVQNLLDKSYVRLPYRESINILEKNNSYFQFPIKLGDDLKKDHEQFLVRHCGNTPVYVTDYPSETKPFYARLNDDGKTVAAVDLLGAWIGELCGGSLREERLNILEERLNQFNQHNFDWYLDLRKFGSCPHGGFGIGFERYIQMITGINHIKEVLPFPRSHDSCKL